MAAPTLQRSKTSQLDAPSDAGLHLTVMGPNLFGVYGRKSGSLPGFSYSQAMRDKDVSWQAENITQLITQPQAYVPGTYMPYMGLASADDRQAVACFLKEQH